MLNFVICPTSLIQLPTECYNTFLWIILPAFCFILLSREIIKEFEPRTDNNAPDF